MKNIILLLLVVLLSFVSGCSDPHVYNEEADREIEAKLQTTTNPNELLLFALKSDSSPSIIKKILKKGASVAVTVGEEELPIICYAKSPKAVKIIYKAHPDNKEKKGLTDIIFNKSLNKPLFYFQTPELCKAYFESIIFNCEFGEYEINLLGESKTVSFTEERVMEELLKQKDKYNRTPLFYAKNNKMIDYWISIGYNLNTADNQGNNVLGYKISNKNECDINILSYLIDKGADVNFGLDKGNKTPLAIALANNRNKDIIELLINKGANVNAGEEQGNMTPLGYALFYNREKEIIEFLISKGAKIENVATTSNLFYCVKNPEQVNFLKSKGISPNITTQFGYFVHLNGNKYVSHTPLANAVGRNLSLNTIQALIDAGADVNKAYLSLGNTNISAYNFAVSVLMNDKMGDLLLKNGAVKSFDIDAVFNYFVKANNVKMVSELLALGINIDNSNKLIDKIFDILLENGDIANLKKIVSNGYDVNKNDISKYLDSFSTEEQRSNMEKFDILIELGYDVNNRVKGRNNILDAITNQFSDINLGNVSKKSFEKIVINTTSLKDRGYASQKLETILGTHNLRVEILEVFLNNCDTLDQNTLSNHLQSIFESYRVRSESTILALIRHIKDFNFNINGKTMIGSALQYENISLEIIKAISEKMYYPDTPTRFRYGDTELPSCYARKRNRNDIADYLFSYSNDLSRHIYIKDGKMHLFHIYIGMKKNEYDLIMSSINPYINRLSGGGHPIFDKNENLIEFYIFCDEARDYILGLKESSFKELSLSKVTYQVGNNANEGVFYYSNFNSCNIFLLGDNYCIMTNKTNIDSIVYNYMKIWHKNQVITFKNNKKFTKLYIK